VAVLLLRLRYHTSTTTFLRVIYMACLQARSAWVLVLLLNLKASIYPSVDTVRLCGAMPLMHSRPLSHTRAARKKNRKQKTETTEFRKLTTFRPHKV